MIARTQGLGLRHYAFLALVALLLLVPGMSRLPPLDRDESRYMEATSQMLRTGDFIDVRFQDQPRYLQPAGIYWLEAAAVSMVSTPEARAAWAYRLPSLTGAVVSVLLTAWIGGTLFGGATGLAAGVLLASAVLLSVEARMATIDATLLAFILAAQTALLRIYLRRDDGAAPGRFVAACYWVALGAGLMLKGPVIVLVSWGTILGLLVAERRARWLGRLHPAWGVPLMLAIVLPWCVAIWIVSHGDFFARSVGHNFLGKVASGQQAHGLPPGYYLTVFTGAFWPGSLFAVLALPFIWSGRKSPQVRFLLAWIIPTWLLFEIVATKLPHYVLPTYPAVACLAAAAALAPGAWRLEGAWRWPVRVYAAIWLVVGAVLAVGGPVLLWRIEGVVRPEPVIAALAAIALMAVTLRFVLRRAPEWAVASACGAALVIFLSTYLVVLPNLTTIWLSPRIAAAVAAVRPCPDSVVASSSFSEPSLVFLVGQDTRLINAEQAADFLLADRRCNLALIGARDRDAFLARMAAENVTPRPLTTIDGINYSTGKRLDLTLFGAAPP